MKFHEISTPQIGFHEIPGEIARVTAAERRRERRRAAASSAQDLRFNIVSAPAMDEVPHMQVIGARNPTRM
jgi:hypothetical protein